MTAQGQGHPATAIKHEQPLKRILGWDDITREVDHLVSVLRDDYDAMLVVTRGGMVPACLISERLDIRNILVAAVHLYTGIGQSRETPIFVQFPGDTLLADKSILVVDDVWDSGRTAMAVLERVRQAGGRPELAVLHYKPRASRFPDRAPDYYAELTDDWIVYPWDDER
jgi:hypoxanthine phosphoribosyltransferase